MKVFKINLAVDDFRSLLASDDHVHSRRLLALDGTSKLHDWTSALQVEFDNTEAPVPDIYSCGAGNMVLWGRSLSILESIICSVAELLPVTWSGGEGKLVNIVGLTECLDSERSSWYCDEDSGKKIFIQQHVFIPEMVPRLVPFKIKAQRFATFVADHEDGSKSFQALTLSENLTGLMFETVWES